MYLASFCDSVVSGPGYGKKSMVCLLDKWIEKGCIYNNYHYLRGPKSDHVQAARCIEQQKTWSSFG